MRQARIQISTKGQGLYSIDTQVQQAFSKWPETGLLHLFLQHTSASLLIQENADPTARQDLQEFLNRLAPSGQPWHRHTLEGPDDTTSHLKSAVTSTELTVPIRNKQLGLGTWQGIYLWEHRDHPHERRLLLTLWGED